MHAYNFNLWTYLWHLMYLWKEMLRLQKFWTLRPTFSQIFTKFRLFERTYYFHLQRGWRRHKVPLQLWEFHILPQYVTSEKKEVFVNIFCNIDIETQFRLKLSLRILSCLKLHIIYNIPSGYVLISTVKQWNICGMAVRRAMQLD